MHASYKKRVLSETAAVSILDTPCRLPAHPAVMPRGVKKENLPSKICETCNKPFNWRKVMMPQELAPEPGC